MKKILNYFGGAFFLLIGIYLAIIKKEPHFYSFFSIGVFIILLQVYNSISKRHLFNKWKLKSHFLFWGGLIITSIIIDRAGIYLNYWKYTYTTIFDELFKYLFEWAVAMAYIMLSFLIGFNIFNRRFSKKASIILSLIIFVTLIGIITEYINHFTNSWTILSMPITNSKIGSYFLIFQTIGYWTMVLVPLIIYKYLDKKSLK